MLVSRGLWAVFGLLQVASTARAASVPQVPLVLETDESSVPMKKFPNARAFLRFVNHTLSELEYPTNQASWEYETDITDEHGQRAVEAQMVFNQALQNILNQIGDYHGSNDDEKRQLELLSLMVGNPKDPEDQRVLSAIEADMVSIYSTANVDGLSLDPDLVKIMAYSRDYDELKHAYLGWRNATGPRMKGLYTAFIDLLNKGARQGGFEDTGELWRSQYDMKPKKFEKMIDKVWKQVLPLYRELHCYTRAKLVEKYGADRFGNDGLIPAHLLGNMWSQDWSTIFDILVPFPDTKPIDVTKALIEQNYSAEAMHRLSESFYHSLGYDKLPQSFWEKSMLTKPSDREVVCHASAWDFGNNDLRIKMCTNVNQEDLFTVHHEQGHLYYDHYYRHLPYLYRSGAADFFHEAIGDTAVLSVVVPKHLKEIGLIEGEIEDSWQQTINYQMLVALSKVAVLPWAFLVDKWRWQVMSGQVPPHKYQQEWDSLLEKYQGIKRPEPADVDSFDPGAKYHIPANTPYMRYFGAAVIQFQFHHGLCKAAGHKGPLHECSIYKNKDVGKKFRHMLEIGSSQPWTKAVEAGSAGLYDTLDGSALIKYFEPLLEYLKKANKKNVCIWK
ncbi:peptidyl-dipeptidase A [Polychytrium aggregatum]|uniref:peptidyl-dipeptidase A n=1 Tax=Polychytrium aggregatum TaxID=110093 RepID=UPI0022FEAA1D|nr:peptidyl-dipeptidase A [Polychytrium aggregatum]KAI9205878.1 peptidyl-dipeptidase A [Polychytrium aggregatum]